MRFITTIVVLPISPLCQEISGHSRGETNEALKSFGLVRKNFPGSIYKSLPGTVVSK
jgi:hypothetical protein